MQRQVSGDTQRRVNLCLLLAILDFLVLGLPWLGGSAFHALVLAGVLLNALAVWMILSGVRPLVDEHSHLMAVAYSKRMIAAVGGLLTIATLAAAFSGAIYRQSIPFLVLGYVVLLLAPMKIMSLAVERRMKSGH